MQILTSRVLGTCNGVGGSSQEGAHQSCPEVVSEWVFSTFRPSGLAGRKAQKYLGKVSRFLAGADSGKVKFSGHVSLSAVEMRLAHEWRNPPDYQKARISTIPCPTRPHTALQVLCVDGHCVRGWILRRCLLATSSAAAVLKLYNPRLAMPARFNMDKSGTPGPLPGGTLDELEGPACDWRQCRAGVLVRTDLEDYPTP
ncbi:hypothetical protein B0H13DRAFT_1855616 [Mycena leptocephala]|nr:hypothetical protein B0H13DRAFT_1855616 [Mycena leptocephala]